MSIGKTYDISVIVPVYNAEQYLRECIDSLLKQTKDNIEIVLVNDGSTDKSKAIIEEYYHSYDNITFVDQPNKGVCIARNAGISASKGKYIGWVDSDDFLKPDALEKLYTLMQKEDADYGYYNISFFPKNVKNKKAWYKEYKGERDWNFIERNSQCTNSLTKKELLERLNIPYWFEKYSEYGWIMVLLFAEKIVCTDEKLYVYRVGHNSSSGGSFLGKVPRFQKAVKMTRELPEMIKNSVYENILQDYFEYRLIYALILVLIVSAINNDKKAYKSANDELKQIRFRKNKYTKIILDNNHGRIKSLVLRYLLPSNFNVAKIITNTVFN